MKIFFSSYHNPNFISITEYIECAIRELGHTMEIFDWYKFIIPGRIRSRFPFLNFWDVKRINKELIARVKSFKPDVLLIAGGFTLYSETILTIRNLVDIITVNWAADYPRMFDFHLKISPDYHFFFTSSSDGLQHYKNAGHRNGYWLPFACDSSIHKPLQLTEKEKKRYGNDICFVGSMYSERTKILEGLCDFDLGIWGIGWERLSVKSPLRSFIRGGILNPAEWVKVYNASKIVLNILTVEPESTSFSPIDKEQGHVANTKLFEILGCGAFQIVESKKDVLSLFIPGEHLVVYKSINELRKLILYYLKNSSERERIARNGREIAIKRHTYKHRIEEILSIIKRNKE